jgi:hypothetical protein
MAENGGWREGLFIEVHNAAYGRTSLITFVYLHFSASNPHLVTSDLLRRHFIQIHLNKACIGWFFSVFVWQLLHRLLALLYTMSSALPGREGSGRNSNELHHSMRQSMRPLPDPGLNMAFEQDSAERRAAPDPLNPESRARLSADDARRDDYWRGYYDRKRREAESQYYQEPPRPLQRYLEYPEDQSTAYRSGSRASRAPASYQPRNRMTRPLSDMPKKIPVELDDDDYEEVYIVRGDRRGPPTEVPRRKPSFDSLEYRLPYTKWMSKTLKGHLVAGIGEFVGTSKFLISYARYSTLTPPSSYVSLFRFRRHTGC